MKPNKTSIGIVISIGLISLIGLLVIQVNWLNKSIAANQHLFQQKIDMGSKKAGDIYREKLPNKIHNLLIQHPQNKKMIDSELEQIIDSSFSEFNLPLDYTYGIFKHGKNGKNLLVAGNTDNLFLENSSCQQVSGREFGWTNLTCGLDYDIDNAYHLAIFPSYSSFIFNEVKETLFASFLFITLIFLSFLYAIKFFKNQKKLSDLKDDFINNLTHEFKTPIFSISIASKSLRKDNYINNSSNLSSYIDVIDAEGIRLKNQVDKILQLSLIDSDRFCLEKKEIDVHDQLKKIAKSFELQLQEKGGSISFNFQAEKYIINADQLHIRNVWYNLIDNAIKYSDDKPQVFISTKDLGNEFIEVSFKDNGMGISQENQRFIFDRFYRASSGNIHQVKGFGIGLSYVKAILNLHGGEIALESQKGEGSIFITKIPVL